MLKTKHIDSNIHFCILEALFIRCMRATSCVFTVHWDSHFSMHCQCVYHLTYFGPLIKLGESPIALQHFVVVVDFRLKTLWCSRIKNLCLIYSRTYFNVLHNCTGLPPPYYSSTDVFHLFALIFLCTVLQSFLCKQWNCELTLSTRDSQQNRYTWKKIFCRKRFPSLS